ncbi:unnamed protein product, partial [Ixodes hexagonus]
MAGGDLCCVASCRNHKRIKPGLSYFSFPKDDKVRSLWLLALCRNGRVSTRRPRVCSEHFADKCFEEKAELQAQFGLRFRRMLKPGSVPTVFGEKHPPSKVRAVYAAKRRRLKHVNRVLAATSSTPPIVAERPPSRHKGTDVRKQERTRNKSFQVSLQCVNKAVQTRPLKKTGTYCICLLTVWQLNATAGVDKPCDRLRERNCVVDELCLTQLLKKCPSCRSKSDIEVTQVGELVKATITCPWQHVSCWYSRPL